MRNRSEWMIAAALIGAMTIEAMSASPPEHKPLVAPPPIGRDPLAFTLRPGAWFPRLGGDAQLGVAGGVPGDRLHVDDDLHLRERQPTVHAELLIRKADYWELGFSGFSFSVDGSGTASRAMTFGGAMLAPGDAFRSEFRLDSGAVELKFGMFQPMPGEADERNCTSCGRRRVDLRFSPIVGARYASVRHTLDAPGSPRQDARGEWFAPYIGLNLELTYRPDGRWPLTESIMLDVSGSGGPALGGDGGFVWQIQAGIVWHATRNLGIMAGYRLVELDVERGDYQFKGGLQGLLIAGSLRF